MSKLSWISDSVLSQFVSDLLNAAQQSQLKANNSFGKNVIDPFSAIFEISGFSIDHNLWKKSETSRQAQKSLQNHIGEFHQKVLGSAKGWTDLRVGHVIDLESKSNKIIAEVKNKYNTVSFGKLKDLYSDLDNLVSPKSSIYKGFTVYYVAIIPKKPNRYDRPFTPSDKATGTRCPVNQNIREIDGPSFYSLVTGKNDALKELYDVLPSFISKSSGYRISRSDFSELLKYFDSAFA